MSSSVELKKALAKDAAELAEASKQAFHSDIECGAPGLGGPPGYDSPRWHAKMMRMGNYYKILVDRQMAGGVIIFRQAPREYQLGMMFIDPVFQGRGIGTRVFGLIWELFPLAKRWTLDTPVWNTRTRHFYKKVGFVEVGVEGDQVNFERVIT